MLSQNLLWIVFYYLVDYIEVNKDPILVEKCLRNLCAHGFVRVLPQGKCLSKQGVLETVQAIEACLTVAELSEVYRLLCGSKKAKMKKTKRLMLLQLKEFVLSQRRLDGSFMAIHKELQKVLAKNYTKMLQQKSERLQDSILIFRVVDEINFLFNQVFKFYYVYTVGDVYQHSNSYAQKVKVSISDISRTSSKVEFADLFSSSSDLVNINPTSNDLPYFSLRKNITNNCCATSSNAPWTGLLVLFQQASFASYECNIRIESTTPDVHIKRSIYDLFSVGDLLCYEIAYELYLIMDFISNNFELSALKYFFFAGESHLATVKIPPEDSVHERKSQILVFSLSLKEIEAMVDCKQKIYSNFQSIVSNASSLLDLMLEVVYCFNSYIRTNLFCDNALKKDENAIPDYLFRKIKGAGSYLARFLSYSVKVCEQLKQYEIANFILGQLVSSENSFLTYKRGHWWDRLSLNCASHLKKKEMGIYYCEKGLQDSFLSSNQRLTLKKRLHSLTKASSRLNTKTTDSRLVSPSITNSNGIKEEKQQCSAVDYFFGSSSDSENENNFHPLKKQKRSIACDVSDSSLVIENDLRYDQSFDVEIIGRAINCTAGEKSRFIGLDINESMCTVEQLVIQDFSINGNWCGVHCEGRPLYTIYGVLMWDIIFANVPNVFYTPYQTAPLDFACVNVFYENRKAIIEKRLQEIREMTSAELVVEFGRMYRKNYGILCNCVSWDSYSLQYLQCISGVIGGPRLAMIMLPLTKNLRHLSCGLPDLLLLRIQVTEQEKNIVTSDVGNEVDSVVGNDGLVDISELCHLSETKMRHLEGFNFDFEVNYLNVDLGEAPKEDKNLNIEDDLIFFKYFEKIDQQLKCDIQFVEVKSARDRLSTKQIIWIKLLKEIFGDESVFVCNVIEQERGPKKNRKS